MKTSLLYGALLLFIGTSFVACGNGESKSSQSSAEKEVATLPTYNSSGQFNAYSENSVCSESQGCALSGQLFVANPSEFVDLVGSNQFESSNSSSFNPIADVGNIFNDLLDAAKSCYQNSTVNLSELSVSCGGATGNSLLPYPAKGAFYSMNLTVTTDSNRAPSVVRGNISLNASNYGFEAFLVNSNPQTFEDSTRRLIIGPRINDGLVPSSTKVIGVYRRQLTGQVQPVGNFVIQ